MPDGSIKTVQRQGFMRRSARKDAWKYHLREMALAEEPLRYLRKYLNVEEDLTEELAAATADEAAEIPTRRRAKAPKPPASSASAKHGRTKPLPRPLPTGVPAFLTRPFK
jgi:hypothetical protein